MVGFFSCVALTCYTLFLFMFYSWFVIILTRQARTPPMSGRTVRSDRLPVGKNPRICSIVVSGNKKRRSTHTETRRPRADVVGMNVFVPRRPPGERGHNFIGSSYTRYSPFSASCLRITITQSQDLNFLQMTVLSDR